MGLFWLFCGLFLFLGLFAGSPYEGDCDDDEDDDYE